MLPCSISTRPMLFSSLPLAMALLVLTPPSATATDTPVPTSAASIKTKSVKLQAKADSAFALPAVDPAITSNSIAVSLNLGQLADPLTAGQWKTLGKPEAPKGYKYTNKAAPEGGPCKSVIVSTKKIKISCKGAGTIPAPLPPNFNSDLLARFELDGGNDVYCAHAVAPHFKEIAGKLVKVKKAPAPPDCSCLMGTDSDGDGLDNCAETDTGVYVSAIDTGTSPFDADTDGDGIEDGDEVLGTAGGLDLPAMGVSPLRRDVLIETDWFDDSLDCGAHTHRPAASALAQFDAAFAAAPITNPDGTTGINVIHDYGQGGLFTGGNLIADADGVLNAGVNFGEFVSYKFGNFAANRHGYFHYSIFAHRYALTSDSSGQAELPGDDFIVSLQCFLSDSNVSHTMMHEIGHNFGLQHGGDESCNYKPNYNSVMNYRYQFPGIDGDCTPPGDGILDYSIGDRITLDETDLDENAGTCGAPSWDWNGVGGIQSGVVYDVNLYDDEIPECGGSLTVLGDHDDWANLGHAGLSDSDGFPRVPFVVVDCDNRPPAY